jgi:hypothetical protein
MSMTQAAFLKKADLPTKSEIEQSIRELGYDFNILDNFECFYGVDGIECIINGQKTFFKIYFNNPNEITAEFDFIVKDLTDQDTVVSFIWGADFAAGASIGLISVVLIDKCQALVYYLDDKIAYTKEMLLSDTPEFLKELEKENKRAEMNNNRKTKPIKNEHPSLWEQIKRMWK